MASSRSNTEVVYGNCGDPSDDLKLYRDYRRLATTLGFVDSAELQRYMASPLFLPAWLEFWTDACAKDLFATKTRGKGMGTILSNLESGKTKYQTSFPRKDDWTLADHTCYLIYRVRRYAIEEQDGFLNDDDVIHMTTKSAAVKKAIRSQRVWHLVARMRYDHAPERIAARSIGSQISGLTLAKKGKLDPRTSITGTSSGAVSDETGSSRNDDDLTDDSEEEIAVDEPVDEEMTSPIDRDNIRIHTQSSVTWRRRCSRYIASLTHGTADDALKLDHLKYNLEETFDDDMTAIEQEGWLNSLSNLDESDQQVIKNSSSYLKTIEKYLDNKELQPMDLESACKDLNIVLPDDPRSLRLPNMRVPIKLKAHQVTAIAQIKENMADGRARGTILADPPGLGKTIVTAGVLQDRINTVEKSKDADHHKKPWLVIVPPHLIAQFAADLTKFAPGLEVWMYYGQRAQPKYRFIPKLNRDHEIFQRSDAHRHVVITSSNTFVSRHGPSKYEKWWKTNHPLGSPECLKEPNHMAARDWTEGLHRKFDGVVIDEAHSLRSPDTELVRAIFYLEARTHLLLTGSPFVNSINDFEGYLYLLQHRGAAASASMEEWDKDDMSETDDEIRLEGMHDEDRHSNEYNILVNPSLAPADEIPGALWARSWLKPQGLSSNFDPFKLPEWHPAADLRFSTKAFRDFIMNEKDDSLRGHRIRQLWKRLMIRRTYESAVPGNTTQIISNGLPAIYKRTIYTEFDSKLNAILENKTSALLKKLYKMKRSTRRTFVNWSIERRLQLLPLWLDFEAVQDSMKSGSTVHRIEDKNFLHWAVNRASESDEPAITYDTSLQVDEHELLVVEILKGAPKLRALIFVLADKVFKSGGNAIVWCNTPASVVLTAKVLEAVGHTVKSIHSAMSPGQRQKLQDQFNTRPTDGQCPTVLVTTYKLAACGLNLQKACCYAAFLDQAPNDATFIQAVGRIRRIGSTSPYVYIDEFVLKNSYDERVRSKIVQATLPRLFGELDVEKLQGSETTTELSADFRAVIYNGELRVPDDPEVTDLGLEQLGPIDICKWLIGELGGLRIDIEPVIL